MKKYLVLLIIAVMVLLISGANKSVVKPDVPASQTPERNGVAIIMTGAAARIPQEAALLEELANRGLLKNVVFISGVSSGSLNAVMLNGILSGKITWGEYRKILFGIRNKDIFIQDDRKLPVNTSPARNLFTSVVERKLGYRTIGDLPITTNISITHLSHLDLKKEVFRMYSRKINPESDTTLSLVDLMMASTSFPIAFPPARIRNAKTIPDVEYVDGGVGDDHVPYHALLEFEKKRGSDVEKIYIISRKSDSIPEISEELKGLGINDKGLFDKLGVSLDAILKKGMIKRLEDYISEAPGHMKNTYIWIPDFQEDFMLFNFDKLQEQYLVTTEWAKKHNPVPLEEYMLTKVYGKKEKR